MPQRSESVSLLLLNRMERVDSVWHHLRCTKWMLMEMSVQKHALDLDANFMSLNFHVEDVSMHYYFCYLVDGFFQVLHT